MASRTSTPQSRSRSSSGSSSSSDTTMIDAPPQTPSRPVRLRNLSTSHPGPATTPDPTFSLLLSLPKELRDRVYTLALTSHHPFWWPKPDHAQKPHKVSIDLLRANKQIFREAGPIVYSGNKFLFTHPSDCNIFRVITSPCSVNITSVYFRIREKDLRIWTSYLSSKSADRSLKADLPNVKNIWIFLRCGSMGTPAMLGQLGAAQGHHGGGAAMGQGIGNLPPGIQIQVQAVHNALGQQVQALQQQLQNVTAAGGPVAQPPAGTDPGNQIPPPPPPPPAMPFLQFAQGGLGLAAHGHGHAHAHHHPAPAPAHHHGTQNNIPPPPPPPPLAPPGATQPNISAQTLVPGAQHTPHHHHHHTLYTTFLRFEREIGLESLCFSLQETLRERSSPPNFTPSPSDRSSTGTPSRSSSRNVSCSAPDIKIVCIMRIPNREVDRLVRLYPDELSVDWHANQRDRDARTKFRKLHGVEVCLEVSGYHIPGDVVETGEGGAVQG